MMDKQQLYNLLDFTDSLTEQENVKSQYAEYVELASLGADKCYFADGKPAMLFMDVRNFDEQETQKIARVLHKAWNYRKVLLLMVCGEFEVRVYNCYTKPLYFSSEKKINLDKALLCSAAYDDVERIRMVADCFSKLAIDNGTVWNTDNSFVKKIELKNRVDAYLVCCLNDTTEMLSKMGLTNDVIHALLLRSLFILFLEDKGSAKEAGLYERIMPTANSYFDVLESKTATYALFKEVNIHFNGNITPIVEGEIESVCEEHLKVIRKCFYDGDLSGQEKLFGDWRLFKFDVIQIQLLSEIYEHFLMQSKKKERGQYYTPANLVDLILSEKMPIAEDTPIKPVLDPTCGSGIFLVNSFKRIVKIWRLQHKGGNPDFNTLKQLLLDNIYGIEIDETAVKVAAFSLYLALIDELDPKTLWIEDDYQLPYLIHSDGNDNKHQGWNLWCMDAIVPSEDFKLPEIGLLVGNPPFGTKIESQSIKNYLNEQKFAHEMVLAFMHLATKLCPRGEISLVCNFKIFTNTNGKYQKFREWLMKETYVEKIYNFSIFRNAVENYGGSLFATAVAPVAVVYYTLTLPKRPSDVLAYWAPKTYVKSNVVDGIVIDNADLKFLPRILCSDPQTNIWKLGMWGNSNVHRLLQRLSYLPSLKQAFEEEDGWIVGKGLNCDSSHPDIQPAYLVNLDAIDSFYTEKQWVKANRKFYRKPKEGLFNTPYVLLKEMARSTGMVCCLYDGIALSTTSTFVFNHPDENTKIILTAFLNSKLANSLLFWTSSTWGIERDRLQKDEILALPSPFHVLSEDVKCRLLDLVARITELKKFPLKQEDTFLVDEINELFYEAFAMTPEERILVEDAMKFDMDLFYKERNSEALKRAFTTEVTQYAEMLGKELNTFMDGQISVSIKVYEANVGDALRMVVLKFGEDATISTVKVENLHSMLRTLKRGLISRKSYQLYVQKVLKYYDGDTITLVKPNSKRYWTRTQAMDDAAVILSDILNMKEGDNVE